MDKIKVLVLLSNQPNISQREIANQLVFSLGKVNKHIKNLLAEQLIYVENKAYYLSEKGKSYLENAVQDKVIDKIPCTIKKDIKTAVIISDKVKEFDYSSEIYAGENLLNYQISLLKKLGITKIIVVIGEQAQKVKNSLNHDVIVVENVEYLWTGSAYSLQLCKDYLEEDFLLFEGSSVIDYVSLYNFYHYDAHILCGNSQQGLAQKYVEWAKDYTINRIAFNKSEVINLAGSLVGVMKISFAIYQKLLAYFQLSNNAYLDYLVGINYLAQYYKIKVAMDNYMIAYMIDSFESLLTFKKAIMKKIIKRETAMERLSIAFEQIFAHEQILRMEDAGGLTNNNYIIKTDREEYIMRLPGVGANELVNRHNEKQNTLKIQDLGINVFTYYFDENSGIKLTKRIKDCVTLTSEMAQYPYYIKKMVTIFQQLHNSNIQFSNEFDFLAQCDNYESLVKKQGVFFENYEQVKQKVLSLYTKMKRNLDFKLVCCHNDTLADNFILDATQKMYLIDWEYSGMNDLFWDLAAVMLENDFTKESEELLLYSYFNGQVLAMHREKILIFKIMQDFLWTIWSNYKIALGEDFNEYGQLRYQRCQKLIKEYEERYE